MHALQYRTYLYEERHLVRATTEGITPFMETIGIPAAIRAGLVYITSVASGWEHFEDRIPVIRAAFNEYD